MRAPPSPAVVALVLGALAPACSSSGRPPAPAPGPPAPAPGPLAPAAPPSGASYEVHEWGLLRGTPDDRVVLSGPRAEPVPVVMAKPVLYFHRHGDGALQVDVSVRIAGGRVVERWPSLGGAAGDTAAWQGVLIQSGSCHGSHYPTLGEPPCAGLPDGCEAATLAAVETTDSDCAYWPRPPDDDGPTLAWNHLFYRGEVTARPTLPLHVSRREDGTLHVTADRGEPIPGRLLRVRRSNGVAGIRDAAEIVAPPAPGASVVVASPAGPLSAARDALSASLRAAGLTEAETAAFGRSWDDALFGATATASTTTTPPPVVSATPVVAGPVPAPRSTTSLLYVLPASAADRLAPLTFSPPPREVRRALVVWIDEAAAGR